MSIVRIGLSEHRNFSQGWDTIFSKTKKSKPAKSAAGKKRKSKARKK